MKKVYIKPYVTTVKIETSAIMLGLSTSDQKAVSGGGMEARSYIDNPEEDDFVSSQNVWDSAW